MKYSFFLLLLVLTACSQSSQVVMQPPSYTGQYEGNVSTIYSQSEASRTGRSDTYAPNIVWKNSKGAFDSLSGQTGKVVLLNFWASWCAPCKSEMPDLQYLSSQYGDSVVVIGLSIDAGNAFDAVKQYIAKNAFTYQFVVDSEYTLFRKYVLDPTTPIPQTLLIAPNGKVFVQLTGQQSRASFLSWIDKAKR